MDVIQRLEPVIIEIERERECVCVVAHQAILRALYGYFMKVPLAVNTLHPVLQEHCPPSSYPTAYPCRITQPILRCLNCHVKVTPWAVLFVSIWSGSHASMQSLTGSLLQSQGMPGLRQHSVRQWATKCHILRLKWSSLVFFLRRVSIHNQCAKRF